MKTNDYSDFFPETDVELPYYLDELQFEDYSQIADEESEYDPSIPASDRVEVLTKNIREYERKGWRVLNAPPVWNRKKSQFEVQKGPRARNWA